MTMRSIGKIIFGAFLITSVMMPSVLPFSAKYAAAQSASAGAGGSIGTGFNAGGLIASAISCSGVMDKLASALSQLLGGVFVEVSVGDAGLRTKENCFDAIVHQIVVLIMDKITLATVDWINSGFEGQPLYLSDPDEFFANIAKKEINSLTGWYGCTTGSVTCGEDYPFGALVMGSIVSSIQSQLAANVKFSLNQVLAHGTYEEYKFDFNVGGWAGYTAFLEPNNNPFGNSLLINRELGRRIGGTTQTVTKNFNEQLTQSGGFLNQRRCDLTATEVVGDAYIPLNDSLHHEAPPLAAGELLSPSIVSGLPTAVQDHILANASTPEQAAAVYNDIVLRSKCLKWVTTTPGNVVSNKITSALNISDNRLIQADEVSESLGLIFDALINQLVGSGLESLSSFWDGGSSGQTSVLLAQVNGEQPGQVTNDQIPPPAIDAITGTGVVDTELIVVQQQYITNANIALPILSNLIQKIRALDYCVPGPNPNWLDNAEENFQNVLYSVAPFSSNLQDQQDAEDANQDYYAAAINTITGIDVAHTPAMHNHTQFTAFMNNLFSKYAAKMQDANDLGYNRFLAPPTTRILLSGLLEDMNNYQASYDTLSSYVTNIPSYLPTLINIDNALDQIAQQNGGVLSPAPPNIQAQIDAQISIFNSISDHFATPSQLSDLISSLSVFQAQQNVVNGHLDSCISETLENPNGYPYPNRRDAYLPGQYFPYTHSVTGTGLPGPDTNFLPSYVDFSENTNGGDIDVSFENVDIIGTESLDIFEAVLQSVY